jgi:hypothetical protein
MALFARCLLTISSGVSFKHFANDISLFLQAHHNVLFAHEVHLTRILTPRSSQLRPCLYKSEGLVLVPRNHIVKLFLRRFLQLPVSFRRLSVTVP